MAPFIQKTVYSDPAVDYHNYAIDVRGRIINAVAEMEEAMDNYICSHFCYNLKRRKELREIIVSTKYLTFQAKAEIFRCLLERRKAVTPKEGKKIIAVLVDKIAKNRNIIAHAMLDPKGMWQFKNDKETLSFIKYSNGQQTITYNKQEILKILEFIQAVKGLPLILKSEKHHRKIISTNRRKSPSSS